MKTCFTFIMIVVPISSTYKRSKFATNCRNKVDKFFYNCNLMVTITWAKYKLFQSQFFLEYNNLLQLMDLKSETDYKLVTF